MSLAAAGMFSSDRQEEWPTGINKKLFNWLRDLFHDPPYLYDLYKAIVEQARNRAGALRQREDQRPPQPPSPPDNDQQAPWIYFPKGDGGSSLSEWLAGNGGGDSDKAAVSHDCEDAANVTGALARGVANCTSRWIVDIAQNGTAAAGQGVDGVFARGGRVGLTQGKAWPPWSGDFDGNFTFYDYDYDSMGWPESQLEKIYEIIRKAQWNSNIALTAFLGLIFLVGIAGNLLVLAVFAKSRVKQASSLFIMALAGTDLIICSIVLPGVLLKEWAVPFRYDAVCKLYEWLRCTTIPLSSLILVAVAVDRYVLIGRAAVTQPLSNRAAKAIILLAVVASAGMALPPSLGVGVYQRTSGADTGDDTAYDDYYRDVPPTSIPATTTIFPLSDIIHFLPFSNESASGNPTHSFSPLSFPATFPSASPQHRGSSPSSASTEPYLVSLNTWPPFPVSSSKPLAISTAAQTNVDVKATSGLSDQKPVSPLADGTVQGTNADPTHPSYTLSTAPSHSFHPSPVSWPPPSRSLTGPQFSTSIPGLASSPPAWTSLPLDIDTRPPAPAEFYFGLCWQNDLLVNAAFTQHYWQAVAALFLLVLIVVLVLYGLVFRAVHRQSRRWGRQPCGIGQPLATDRRVRGGGGNDCGNRNNRELSQSTFSDKTGCLEAWSNRGSGLPRLHKLQREGEMSQENASKASSNTDQGRAIESCSPEEKTAKANLSHRANMSDCGEDTKRNGYIGNDEDDVTSLDDGHYSDWAANSSIYPEPPHVNVERTSIFCTGSCMIGRTKHYRSSPLYCSDQTTQQVHYHNEMDSTTSVVTKTTHISREAETPYRRPGLLKRKFIKALRQHTGWHQRHKKVHDTAVFKLARRQKAKVRMLNSENSTRTCECSDQTTSEPVSGSQGQGEDSLCNHFEIESIQAEERVQSDNQTVPLPKLGDYAMKIREDIQAIRKQQQEYQVLKNSQTTGGGLQGQINGLTSNTVYSAAKIVPFAEGRRAVKGEPKSSLDVNLNKQLSYNNDAFNQDEAGTWYLRQNKPGNISSPFDSGIDATESHALTYDFSLPNTPLPDQSYKDDQGDLESQRENAKGKKFTSSQGILNPIIQRHLHKEAGLHRALGPMNQNRLLQASTEQKEQVHKKSSLSKNPSKQVDFQTTKTKQRGMENPQTQSKLTKQGKKLLPLPLNQEQAHSGDGGQTRPASSLPRGQRRRYSAAQVKTAKVLLLVTAVYLVSFAPALLMILDLVPPQRIIFYAYFIHSAANPLIYSFINQTFRKQLAGIFKGKKRHGQH